MTHIRAIAAAAAVAALLSGCGTMGRTPDKLISQVKNMNNPSAIQKYEVDRPLAQVTSTLKEQARRCLAVTVTNTHQGNYAGTTQTDVLTYTPRVTAGGHRTRLTLQKGFGEEVRMVGEDKPEPDGWYIMVVDAYPAGPHRTRVEAYSGNGDNVAFKAVKHWIEGDNLGCPDMSRL